MFEDFLLFLLLAFDPQEDKVLSASILKAIRITGQRRPEKYFAVVPHP